MQNILEGNKEYYGSVGFIKFINGKSTIAERFKSDILGFYF